MQKTLTKCGSEAKRVSWLIGYYRVKEGRRDWRLFTCSKDDWVYGKKLKTWAKQVIYRRAASSFLQENRRG